MLRKPTIVFIALLLAALAGIAGAQSGDIISVGDSVTGELAAENLSAQYRIMGYTDDVLTITLTSEDFDAFLTLLGPDGEELVSDDDSGGGTDARIADYTLPVDGLYTIVVDSYNRISTGQYRLSVTGTVRITPTPSLTLPPVTLITATPQPATLDAPTVEPPPAEAVPISPGDTVTGTLTRQQITMPYRFEGRAGQLVTITLISDDFDAFLTLLDEDGEVLITDDDRAGDLNARIDSFPLPADGVYTIIASSYNNASLGDYILILAPVGEAIPAPTTTEPPPTAAPVEPTPTASPAGDVPGALALGDTVGGTLTGARLSARYTFEGRAGEAVTITLRSGAFDAFLILLDADGDQIASDDDSAGDFDARIAAFALPADGVYTIVATSYSGGGTGDYTLSLESAAPPVAVTVTPAPSPDEAGADIGYGQTVTGSLPPAETAVYRFSGQAGEVVIIGATAADFDATLELRLDGELLVMDDDSGGRLNPLIGPYTLPAGGAYEIVVGGFSGQGGMFSLHLSQIALVPIAYGDIVPGEFTPETRALYYRFEGQRGDIVHIRAESGGTVDTSLSVRDPNGIEIAFDDDSGGGFDPQIKRLMLSQDGTHTLLVRPFLDTVGRVNVILLREYVRSLDEQAQTVQLNEKQTSDALTFTGSAGERARLFVRVLDTTNAAPVVTVVQDGGTLASADITAASAFTLEFVITADGPVMVQISDASFSRVTLELALERLNGD